MRRITGHLCLMTLGLLVFPAPTELSAQTVAEFNGGKSITLQVGYPPGGGYDVYARVFAPFLGRHIPGNPFISIQNVPGAGSLKLANDLYNVAPRDGRVIGAIGREQVTAPLFSVAGARFDAKKMNWLGTLDRASSVCLAWHTTPFLSMEDALQQEMVVGGTGPASLTVVLPSALRELLGYKLKVVSGYPGGNEIALALERGEVHGRCGWSYASLMSTHPEWVREKKVRVLAAASRLRIPHLPDIPSVLELAKDEKDRQILALILAGEAMARPFVAPPGIPADRLAALRYAFTAASTDPQFVAEAQKLGLEIDPADWKEMTDNIEKLYATPPEVVEVGMNLIKNGKL